MRKVLALGMFLLMAGSLTAAAQPLTAEDSRSRVRGEVDVKVHTFPLSAVRLLEGPFQEAMQRDAAYLFDLDPDRLLHDFRRLAGLEPKAPRYEGWESMGLAGHTLGHYLSALAMYYAASGDERARERIDYIVNELAEAQAAHGDGYVAAIPDGRKLFAEVQQGQIETSPFRLNGVWAPWYTMHKQLAGLLDAYWHAGNQMALGVAKALADWTFELTKDLTETQWQEMLACEHGGMNEALANLYAITGDERYLTLSRKFHHRAVLVPLARRDPRLAGLHANTQIPKVIGAVRQYELMGDDSLKTIADFFWEQVVHDHTYVIGGNTQEEFFGPSGQLADRLKASTAETCNTYNMLRLTRHLFALDPKVRYADFYERALYNHILASQEPREGMFTYYVSLKPGHFKTYSTPEGAFWCCVGTGMENHVKYGEGIYFHGQEEGGEVLYVNLFIASELSWEKHGLHLRQETRFPEDNKVRLVFSNEKPVPVALKVRHPSWAEEPLLVTINGEAVDERSEPGSYLVLSQTWQDGDVVELELPMALRTEAMPDKASRVAILYGPIVLGGALGTAGMPEGGAFADSDARYLEEPTPAVPVLVADPNRVEEWVQPLAGDPLTFHTVGVGRPADVVLKPFYRLHHERYTVYWDLFSEEGWREQQAAYQAEQARRRAIEAATVDVMRLGEMLGEEEHHFQGERTEKGVAYGAKYREAAGGGWFSFDVAVRPDRPMALLCTYRGGTRSARTFDILVDGERMATQNVSPTQPDAFFDEIYPLPEAATRGKNRVTVRFEAPVNQGPSRVYGCRMLEYSEHVQL